MITGCAPQSIQRIRYNAARVGWKHVSSCKSLDPDGQGPSDGLDAEIRTLGGMILYYKLYTYEYMTLWYKLRCRYRLPYTIRMLQVRCSPYIPEPTYNVCVYSSSSTYVVYREVIAPPPSRVSIITTRKVFGFFENRPPAVGSSRARARPHHAARAEGDTRKSACSVIFFYFFIIIIFSFFFCLQNIYPSLPVLVRARVRVRV